MYNEKGLLMVKGPKETLTSIINDIYGSKSIDESIDVGKADTFAKIYILNYIDKTSTESYINIMGDKNLKTKHRESIEMFKERTSDNYIIKIDFDAVNRPNEHFFGLTLLSLSEKYDVEVKATSYSDFFGIQRRLSYERGNIIHIEELNLSQYFDIL